MRFEHKYLVRNDKLDTLRKLISPFAKLDPFVPATGEYIVRSVYYDSARFKHYYDKVKGLSERRKIRIRGYNQPSDDATIFLEIKRKKVDRSIKNRSKVSFKDLKELLETGNFSLLQTPKEQDNASKFLFNIKKDSLLPSALVVYNREPFQEILPTRNNLRITFDKNIRSKILPSLDNLFDDNELLPSLNGYFVLEVKFNQSCPRWLANVISTLGLRRRSVSKYEIAIDDHGILKRSSERATFIKSATQNSNKMENKQEVEVK